MTGPATGRIYLVGFMAAGKSSAGRALADLLGRPFVDLDTLVEERSGRPLRQIFLESGERSFRALEHEALVEGAIAADAVVATGGGTFVSQANRLFLEQTGVTIWLDIPYTVVAQRVGPHGEHDRPMFRNEEQARALLRERASSYVLADVRLRLQGDESPPEVARRVAAALGERA